MLGMMDVGRRVGESCFLEVFKIDREEVARVDGGAVEGESCE
jgi:hypothetical protein